MAMSAAPPGGVGRARVAPAQPRLQHAARRPSCPVAFQPAGGSVRRVGDAARRTGGQTARHDLADSPMKTLRPFGTLLLSTLLVATLALIVIAGTAPAVAGEAPVRADAPAPLSPPAPR